MGKIIAFANQKGGVGKTTTCVNLAAYLAKMGLKILIVDMDPQGNATTGLGIIKSSLDYSVYNVMTEEVDAKGATIETLVENLYIIPSDIDLAGAEVELVYTKEREKVLKKALSLVKQNYDYILIDCPPSLGLLTINSLTTADGAIIPIQSEYYALEGLSQLMNSIKLVKRHLNPSLQIEGVLLTMNDSRATMSKQIAEEIKKFFGNKLYNTVIPRNVKLAEAPSHGVPIMMHDTRCNGAKAYKAFSEEFYKKERGEL
ncbi:MAG: ParA family protein [Clostridia bacterium]|nr:ParA family protein [Clostridia bacterium]